MDDPPLILETDGDAPPSIEAMLLHQVAILEAQGNAQERAHVARWRDLQERLADYRRRFPIAPPASVGGFRYALSPFALPRVTGAEKDPWETVGPSRRREPDGR
jgi:hypothetical protein